MITDDQIADVTTAAATIPVYFSPSTNGFYTDEIHGENRPADCVTIMSDEHQALLATSLDGKVIKAGPDGKPVAVPDAPSPELLSFIYRRNALAALKASDLVAMRCMKAGVAFPANWAAYDKALRSIVSNKAADPKNGLPPRPSYPAGT